MAPNTDQFLRRQISEAFQRSSERIDREVAEALSEAGEFRKQFDSGELNVVFANIMHTLVDTQKFAGLSVPLVHNVASIEVETFFPRVSVSTVLHVHAPIKAFILIDYVLANHPTRPGSLCLQKKSLCVEEKTARFDLVAKAALATINIESLIERELQNPSQVIRQTLPHRLREYGFAGQIGEVELAVTEDNLLSAVLLTHDGSAHASD